MDLNTFSQGFDTLLNSYAAVAPSGSTDNPTGIELDEHEKSLFLTEAQEVLVLNLYNGRNPLGESFEETEELRRYLAPLITEAELTPITNTSGNLIGMEGTNSYFFSLPDGSGAKPAVWFITYEGVRISGGNCASMTSLEVKPVRQDEYHKIRKNPFRGANNRRALRLDLSEGIVELICKYTITTYYVRYLRKLKPIILTNLDSDNAIEGLIEPTECELDKNLHQKILELAVQMALQSRGYTNNRDK